MVSFSTYSRGYGKPMMHVRTSLNRLVFYTLAILLPAVDVAAGSFEGESLLIDTQVEAIPPIFNDSTQTLPPVASGELVTFDLFLPEGEGLSIEGITLVFENTPLPGDLHAFSRFFSIHSIEGLVGRSGEARGAITSVFNGASRTIGANGYIATVKLRALQDIDSGTTVRLEGGRTQVVDGRTGQRDSVAVGEAFFLITNTDFDLTLDVDTSRVEPEPRRDQGRTQLFGVGADSDVRVEVHGNRIRSAVGFILEFVVQPGLTFESFQPGTVDSGGVFAGASTLPADTTGTSILVTVADTVNAIGDNSGFIGNLIFTPEAGLREARVSLVRGEMLRGGRFLHSGTGSVLISSSIDFDGSRVTDFRDFLLFASVFGTTSTQQGFDGRFDLNANGAIDLADLTILSGIFEEALSGGAGEDAAAP